MIRQAKLSLKAKVVHVKSSWHLILIAYLRSSRGMAWRDIADRESLCLFDHLPLLPLPAPTPLPGMQTDCCLKRNAHFRAKHTPADHRYNSGSHFWTQQITSKGHLMVKHVHVHHQNACANLTRSFGHNADTGQRAILRRNTSRNHK